MSAEIDLRPILEAHEEALGGKVVDVIDHGSATDKERIASNDKKLTVKVRKSGEEEDSSVDVFVKLCVEGTSGAHYNKAVKTFDKEAHFYTNVLPRMKRFARCFSV